MPALLITNSPVSPFGTIRPSTSTTRASTPEMGWPIDPSTSLGSSSGKHQNPIPNSFIPNESIKVVLKFCLSSLIDCTGKLAPADRRRRREDSLACLSAGLFESAIKAVGVPGTKVTCSWSISSNALVAENRSISTIVAPTITDSCKPMIEPKFVE